MCLVIINSFVLQKEICFKWLSVKIKAESFEWFWFAFGFGIVFVVVFMLRSNDNESFKHGMQKQTYKQLSISFKQSNIWLL